MGSDEKPTIRYKKYNIVELVHPRRVSQGLRSGRKA